MLELVTNIVQLNLKYLLTWLGILELVSCLGLGIPELLQIANK